MGREEEFVTDDEERTSIIVCSIHSHGFLSFRRSEVAKKTMRELETIPIRSRFTRIWLI